MGILALFLIIALAGCQATSEANIDPELQPLSTTRLGAPGANPYLAWQRGF